MPQCDQILMFFCFANGKVTLTLRHSPTSTVVRAWRIDTLVLAPSGVLGTLVDVFAVRLDGRLRITFVTYTLICAHEVLAGAVTADT